MGSYWMLERGPRQWALLALLALAFVALAVQQPLAAALLAFALFLVGGAAVAARSAQPAHSRPAVADEEALPTVRLELPDGQVLNARPVALPEPSEDLLLLTRDGYVVVDRRGRVLRRL